MDFRQAVEWVKENEPAIKGYIAKYRIFSPYEESDYLQEAAEAAIVASIRSREKKLMFEATFWKVFRNQISVITPSPGALTHGSNSVPSHLCHDDLSVVSDTFQIISEKNPDIENIYQEISCHLTVKEQEILSMKLGLGHNGKLSNQEIANQLGCVVSNIRDTVNRALARIKSLIEKGVIDPKPLRDCSK